MCGIAGILNTDSEHDHKISIEKMVCALEHRGPDSTKTLSIKRNCYGFTRLSIIDTHSRSMQPMVSLCKNYVLVFNGEIYNYVEIKKELIKLGHKFVTEGDAEVLLNAFIAWGVKSFNKINGMYAFCITDFKTGKSYLVRDRFGQKPLFYFRNDGKVHFCSEIKSLINAGFRFESNQDVWYRYLTLGVSDDRESTFFTDVKQVEPGKYLEINNDSSILKKTYYDIASIAKEQGRFRDFNSSTENDLLDLLCNSIEIHTRSDVPYSIGLSGGFDSSAILSLINQTGIEKPAECFTVDFSDHINESLWAQKAASNFGTKTNVTCMSIDDMVSKFKNCVYHQESPLGGLMNLGQEINFSKIREKKYKVVLDGAGVDEIFCGYKSFHLKYLQLNMKDQNFKILLREYCNFWNEKDSDVIIKLNKQISKQKIRTEIDGTFSNSYSFIKKDNHLNQNYFQHKKDEDLLDMQINYLKYFKLNRGLRMKDRASMQNSIELRSPFIDHRIVEFALSLKTNCYFEKGHSKSIIRKVFADKMNKEVRIANKRSVNAPQGVWLRHPTGQNFVRSIIESDTFQRRGMFDVNKVLSSYNDYCKNPSNNSFFIWQWINYEIWHRIFIDR